MKRHKRLSFEVLEDRTTPSYDFGYALGLGTASIDVGIALAADAAGNVTVAGNYGTTSSAGPIDLDPGPGAYTLPSAGGVDGFAAQYDPQGNLRWGVHFASAGSNGATGAAVDSLGNSFIVGNFTDGVQIGAPGSTPITLTATGGVEGLLTKLDAAGNVVWARTLGEGGVRRKAAGIAVDSAGNVYATGQPEGTKHLYVTKYDGATGATAWSRVVSGGTGITYAGSYTTFASGSDVAVDAAGNVYVTGNFMGTIDFNPSPAQTNNLSNTGTTTTKKKVVNVEQDVFVLKLNAAGEYIWAGNIGSVGSDFGGQIAVDGTGNVYVSGFFQSFSGDADPGPGTLTLPSGGLLVKLNPNRNVIWAKSMIAGNFAVDAAGNVYSTWQFSGTIDADPGPGTFNLSSVSGSNDIVVRKLDSAGNFIWAASMGGPGSENPRAIALDGQGNIFTTGSFQSTADFDPSPGTYSLTSTPDVNGNPSSDVFISKLVPLNALQAAGGTALDAAGGESLSAEQVTRLLTEALARWQAVGVDTSALGSIDIRIADLAGATLGLASGNTISLDANAAGWGWFVDATPWEDSEFTTPGNQGEQNRMDLLTVLAHEIGHLLGYEHEHDGVMQDTLSAGERLTLHGGDVNDYSWLIGLPDLTKKRDPVGRWL